MTAGFGQGRWRRTVEGLWWSRRPHGNAVLLSYLAGWSLFVAAFVFVDWATYEFALAGLSIRPWNPAAGLAFAMLALRGPGAAPWYLAGFLLAELVVRDVITSWTGAIGVGLIKATVFGIAAILLTGRFGADLALARLRDIAVFLVAGTAAAVVAAVGSVTYLDALGIIPPQRFGDAVLRLAVGDALGITVFGLLTVRLVSQHHDWLTSTWFGTRSEAVVTFVVLASVVWMIFGVEETDEFKFFYLLFVPIVIASLRHGLDGSILILALTQIAKFAIMQYRGLPAMKVVDLQYLMLVLTVTTLLIGVVVSERRRLQAEATAYERRLRQRDEALARSARLDLLGTMTASLAHDVNQPLTSARAQARAAERMLAQTEPPLAETRRALGAAVAQIDLAAGIVARLREFLRRAPAVIERTDLASATREILEVLRDKAAAAAIALDSHCAPDLPEARIDTVQYQQVILNLVRNAIEAIQTARGYGGRITVTIERAAAGDAAEVTVEDDGPGFPETIVAELFAPFTTGRREGLGLGLAISRSIVETAGGVIRLVHNRPGAVRMSFTVPFVGETRP